MLYLYIEHKNGWYFIENPNGGFTRYLYYTKREAIQRHRERFCLKGKHIKFIEQ